MLQKKFNIWENCSRLHKTYIERAKDNAEEMDCAAQCADIVQRYYRPGMTLLDVGCGSGWYYWSFQKRQIDIEYYGMDSCKSFIRYAKKYMKFAGLGEERFILCEVENLDTNYDIIVCFNTLCYLPSYHLALERMCRSANKFIIVRSTFDDTNQYRYLKDPGIDSGSARTYNYYNIHSITEFQEFMDRLGFMTEMIEDRRVGNGYDMSDGYPHPWRIILGVRR